MSEDADITIAAAVIEDLLHMLPGEKRAAVLAKAADVEETQRKEREKHGGWLLMSAAELQADKNSQRYWNKIMKLKALVAYSFVRTITNSHSAEDAARLLFGRHHGAPGSGCLLEYMRRLPQWPNVK